MCSHDHAVKVAALYEKKFGVKLLVVSTRPDLWPGQIESVIRAPRNK